MSVIEILQQLPSEANVGDVQEECGTAYSY